MLNEFKNMIEQHKKYHIEGRIQKYDRKTQKNITLGRIQKYDRKTKEYHSVGRIKKI